MELKMRMSLVMIFILGFLFSSAYSSQAGGIPVRSKVQKAAKVAIEDYNREMNTNYEYVSVEKLKGDFSLYSTYYLLVKVKDPSSQTHSLFQTAVWCIPKINFYSSAGMEYVGEAEAEAEPVVGAHYPPYPLLFKPGDWPMAEFAVHNHNRKMNSDLHLEQIVALAEYWTVSDEYSYYYFTLTVHDKSRDQLILVETKVTKHKKLHSVFYESTGLAYVSDIHPHTHLFPPALVLTPPHLIDEDAKIVADFALESHNVKMGTSLEFVHQVGTTMVSYDDKDDLNHQLTIQVIDHLDQGKHKIFKIVVVEKDFGIPELNQFEFVSYAQPPSAAKCQPYDLFAWVSHTLLSKAKHKFTNTLLHQHHQLTTHRLSTIAHHLRSGETINLKSVPFLCEASYNLTDYDTMLSMIAELEEFVPLVDDDATSHTVLIPLLTALAKFEDPIVRDTAVTLLSRVGNHMNKQDVLLSFIPHVKALATGESYAGRVSSTGLLHIAYLSATTELKAELKLLYYKLRRDHMLVVRKAAASNCGIFAVTDEVDVLDGARIWEVWAMVQDFVQNLFYLYQEISIPSTVSFKQAPRRKIL